MGTTTSGGGRSGDRRRADLAVVVTAALLMLAPACGSGEGGDSSETTAGLRPETSTSGGTEPSGGAACEDSRPAVIMDVFMLTTGVDQLSLWLADPAYDPIVVPGGPELLQSYRQRGYDIVYLSALPADMRVGEQPVAQAIEGWLATHSFPTGAGTHLEVSWDSAVIDRALLFKTEILVDLPATGVSPHYGYANSEDDVHALLNGGVPAERIFTTPPVAGALGTSEVTGEGWTEHRQATVDRLTPACAG